MSIFDNRQLGPRLYTRSVASSKCEYFTVNSSLGIPSLIADPCGWDRSMISLREPSFFSRDPSGEQCRSFHGG